jgi:hypothetical protein
MKNETERQITRHSLPTQKCFNIFTHRTKILKFYCQPTNGTFAFVPTHDANPSAKSKEPFFSQRTENNLYFAISMLKTKLFS